MFEKGNEYFELLPDRSETIREPVVEYFEPDTEILESQPIYEQIPRQLQLEFDELPF